MRPILTLAPVLACGALLAGCEAAPQVQPGTPGGDQDVAACARDYAGLIGQPRSVLNTMMIRSEYRVIGPGDMITADFQPNRVNFEYGEDGRITKIGCY